MEVIMRLHWFICKHEGWFPFWPVDLNKITARGVYIIWSPSAKTVVKIGQGDVADRLRSHRQDPKTKAFGADLLVTCASVLKKDRSGVESFLTEQYCPALEDRYPTAIPIAVNLPGR
jgi:hypothetical protein